MQSARYAHGAKRQGKPQIRPGERKEQVIQWTFWRATHSPKNAPDELKKWAVGGVTGSENREKFKKFIRDPKTEGEYVCFFKDEESAVRFANFLAECGLMKTVDVDINEASPSDGIRYTFRPEEKVKMIITAEALRQLRPLGKKEREAYALVKAGKEKHPSSEDAFVDDLKMDMEEDNPIRGLASNLPIPRKSEEEKEKKLVARMPMRRKSASASRRNMPLFPDTETRDRFMEAYNAGVEFSFQLRGSTSLEPTFREALRDSGMGNAMVAFTKVEKDVWKVEIGTEYAKLFQKKLDKLKEGSR